MTHTKFLFIDRNAYLFICLRTSTNSIRGLEPREGRTENITLTLIEFPTRGDV